MNTLGYRAQEDQNNPNLGGGNFKEVEVVCANLFWEKNIIDRLMFDVWYWFVLT
jgi:hypothetical protein